MKSIRWKSKTPQLAISGGNDTNQRYFVLYNYNQKKYTNLTDLAEAVVIDMAFSPDDTHMYFIEESEGIN